MNTKVNGKAPDNAVTTAVNGILLEMDRRLEKISGRPLQMAVLVFDYPAEGDYRYCAMNTSNEATAQVMFSLLQQLAGVTPPAKPTPS